MAPFPIRAAFYLIEACALAGMTLLGLWLARGRFTRPGMQSWIVTPIRAFALATAFLIADWVVTEHLGPQFLALYYLSGVALTAGAITWVVRHLTRRRGAPE